MEISIQLVHIHELEAFTASEKFSRMPVIPISPQRARSHVRNPCARPDDVALALAYADGRLVGYMGALPDMLYLRGAPQQGAWLSCLWVSPLARGKGLAKQLTQLLLEKYGHQVLLSGFTPEAGNLYRRLGLFEEINLSDGIRGYLRPNLAHLMPPRGKFWATIRPLLKAFDGFLSLPNALRLQFLGTTLPCRLRYFAEADEATGAFIAARQLNDFTRTDLNWWLCYPWVTEAPVRDEWAERYPFTAIARQFSTLAMQLLDDENHLIGVLVLVQRDGHLRVPFVWLDQVHAATVAQVIFAHALQMRADMVTLYHPHLVAYCQQHPTPFFWKRLIQRTFFFAKPLAEQLGGQVIDMQDGVGDLGFT